MKTYSISFKYSRSGKGSWLVTSKSVKAESEAGAIAQIQSSYPNVKDIRIKSVK